jgi:hypothetical protein
VRVRCVGTGWPSGLWNCSLTTALCVGRSLSVFAPTNWLPAGIEQMVTLFGRITSTSQGNLSSASEISPVNVTGGGVSNLHLLNIQVAHTR